MTYDIYVAEEVIDAIKRYLNDREEPKKGYIEDNYRRKLYHKDALFLNGNGQRLQGRSILNMMKRYALQSGVCKKKIHTHLWRASGITIADSNNVSLAQIMSRSGHSNIQSVTPYLSAKKHETNMNISRALTPKIETEQKITNMNELFEQLKELQQENIKLKERLDKDSMAYG